MDKKSIPTTTPTDRTPKELIDTVESSLLDLITMLKADPYTRFKETTEFKLFVGKEAVKLPVLLDELTKEKSKEHCDFIKYFFSAFKGSKEFKAYISSNDADEILLPIAIDGTSKLYQLFLQFCKKYHSDEILGYIAQFRNALDKAGNYPEFMTTFNAAMKEVDYMNIDRVALKKMHKKYWDSKAGRAKDLADLLAEHKPVSKSESNTDRAKEKSNDEHPKNDGGEGQQSSRKMRTDRIGKGLHPGAPLPQVQTSLGESGSKSDRAKEKEEKDPKSKSNTERTKEKSNDENPKNEGGEGPPPVRKTRTARTGIQPGAPLPQVKTSLGESGSKSDQAKEKEKKKVKETDGKS